MSLKLADQDTLFAALGIQNDQESRTHVCALLAVFLAEEGVTIVEERLDTTRFRETLRFDLCNPSTSRLGMQVQPLFRKDPHRCIEALFQLACHIKRQPLFYRRVDISPVMLFPRVSVNGIPDSDLRVHRAAWPPQPMFGFRLRDLLAKTGKRRVISADEKWIDATCLDLDLLVNGLSKSECHGFDPARDDILWTREDPSFFKELQHGFRLPSEEVVTRDNFQNLIEGAIAGCHDRGVPRWPQQIFGRCKIHFIIRPHDQVRGSGTLFEYPL
ncbi:hypothetical protein N7492_005005 [Penicillium capsulatum]|uniref:Uncharacterized protein n=1 Tax=Penicillium capsulatum TaxID=69766 RepID=A0A9W9IEZ1_9EURO|nr:hypothetical protein N7492_005005 [Penicillium capsulatum]KAJ6135888.1 hypothetical protein N7512_001048 [Penicillium capsulatum]